MRHRAMPTSARRRPLFRLGPALALLVVAWLVASCDTMPGLPADLLPAGEPLLTVESSGGLCADGPCFARTTVLADGAIVRPDGGRDRIEAQDWEAIVRSIETTDWDAVLAVPFQGTCPTAFDGQELTWRIRTPSGPVVVADCTTAVDYGAEPFRTLSNAIFSMGG